MIRLIFGCRLDCLRPGRARAATDRTIEIDHENRKAVTALGRAIGFGALISTASRAWRDELAVTGSPVGAEYSGGPARVTAENVLKSIRLAISAIKGTPAARWREEGKPDPHDNRYDCERAALPGGGLTDDEIANAFISTRRS